MGNCLKYLLRLLQPFSRIHRMSGKELREVRLIASGGYGDVSQVEDVQNLMKFAVKKMICQTEQQREMYFHEVKVMKELAHCPHVIGYYGSHEIQREGFLQTYILMEYCPQTVYDLLMERSKTSSTKLSEKQILKILKEIAEGLQQMHRVGIYHHDVKIENVLIAKDGIAKLCDFGSSTREKIDLAKIPKSKVYTYEQRFQKYTTMMYRPPQMVDVYLRYPVDERVDIWMLGCVLFTLNYQYHPFQAEGKLSIVNAVVKFPGSASAKMERLIRHILTPNPYYRPTLEQIVRIVDEWEIKDFKMNVIAERIMTNQEYILREEFDKVQKLEWHSMKPDCDGDWTEFEQ